MKKIFISISIISILLIFGSCSKEKQIERRLVKNEGIWNIDEISYRSFENNFETGTSTYSNVGSMEFKKDGTGSITYINPGQPNEVYSFGWISTSDQLILNYDAPLMSGQIEILKILFQSRKEMRLEQTEESIFIGTTYKDVIVYKITK
ncbi:MAG: hypothetical protein WCG64_08810 [Flavobacteriia bacterium]